MGKSIAELRELVDQEQRAVNIQEGQEKMLRDQLGRLTKRLAERKAEGEDLILVRGLCQKVSAEGRTSAKAHIEGMCTSGLQAVFNDGYRFEVDMKELKGRPTADFLVVSPYGELSVDGESVELKTPPEDSRGGGIRDVLSLSLRLAVLLGLDPDADLMILDEPAVQVSEEFAPKVVDFIRTLAASRGIQFIMVTHNEMLADAADKAFRVQLDGAVSKVTEGAGNRFSPALLDELAG